MTRRQVHIILLLWGSVWVAVAVANGQQHWIDRSDMFLSGMLVVALGVHGIWKTDPR